MSFNIRSVLELLCTILSENAVTELRAEIFRQAKFNEGRSTELMWKALFNIVMFLEARAPISKHTDVKKMNQADTVQFVKLRLQNWGYFSKTFAELPTDMTRGSRELLLTLGWLMNTKDIIGEIISRRSSPLHRKITSFVDVPDVSAQLSPSLKASSRSLSARQQLQRQLMMCGRLRLSLRRLYASLQQGVKLNQKIHHYTKGTSLQPELDHLTPLEVYLMRHQSSMKEIYKELTRDNAQLKNLLEWKGKEHVFWEWMESVLSLHTEEASSHNERRQESQNTESVFLSVPVSIADEISCSRTQLRDFILKHEEEMYALDKMLATKKVSYEELEIATHHSEKELAELTQKFSESVVVEDEKDHSFSTISPKLRIPVISESRNPTPYSIQNARRNKKTEIIDMMKDEIQILQQRVATLESELKETQLNNVQKFQNLTGKDETSICILPRYFKQFTNL